MSFGSCLAPRQPPMRGRLAWSVRPAPKVDFFRLSRASLCRVQGSFSFFDPPVWPRIFLAVAGLWRVLGVIVGLIVMAAGMPYLGFSVTSFITMIILLRAVDQSSWLSAVTLAFISTASVFWLFGQMLGMALPRGPWGW